MTLDEAIARISELEREKEEITASWRQVLDIGLKQKDEILALSEDKRRLDAYEKMVRENHKSTPVYDGRWYFPVESSSAGGRGGGVVNKYFHDFREALDAAKEAK